MMQRQYAFNVSWDSQWFAYVVKDTTSKVAFPEMGNYSKLVKNVRVQISKTHAVFPVCKYDMLATIHVVNKS